MTQSQSSWISVPGNSGDSTVSLPTGAELAERARSAVQAKIAAGKYRQGDVEYVREVSFLAVKDKLDVSPKVLERLRRACQLWEVDLTPPKQISSHRKIVGPLIVAAKRLFFPVLRVFLKDTLRKQRDFNAAIISLIAELANAPSSEASTKKVGDPITRGAPGSSRN